VQGNFSRQTYRKDSVHLQDRGCALSCTF
jgi:hypothetical protein